ncbi:MAG TPA: metalloregulator ArsR/SmtB family transcription factor [Longimicrobiales bacterium]|nr:metalloregulator ArsR/SmtB family transcription factor [Longimicrobiales bacterium]
MPQPGLTPREFPLDIGGYVDDTDPSSELVRVLTALADVNRYRIVELLATRAAELSCGAIGNELGLSPSLISHHLAILEEAGIIDRRKCGPWTLNRLRHDELSRRLSALEKLARPDGVA